MRNFKIILITVLFLFVFISIPKAFAAECSRVDEINGDYYYKCDGIRVTQTVRIMFGDFINNIKINGNLITWSFYDGIARKTSFHSVQLTTCGSKPGPVCRGGQLDVFACSVDKTCDSKTLERLYFNIGKSVDPNMITAVNSSSYNWFTDLLKGGSPPETARSKVDICTLIPSLSNDDSFYVLSDSNGSDWQSYRYHLYSFIKGSKKFIEFDNGRRKRNVNYADYDGNCNIEVVSKYQGDDSNHTSARIRIAEVGNLSTSEKKCKSQIVNKNIFEENGNMLDLENCGTSEIQDKYIYGSNFAKTLSIGWNPTYTNICHNLAGDDFNLITQSRTLWWFRPLTSEQLALLSVKNNKISTEQNTNKKFYLLLEANGSWVNGANFPVYEFQFGTAKTINYNQKGKKANDVVVSYDGNCSVAMFLSYHGKNTEQWDARIRYYETGFVDNTKCYSQELEKYPTTFNRYYMYAPFMTGLRPCLDETNCTLSSKWSTFFDGNCVDTGGGVSLFANPNEVDVGGSSVLEWVSENTNHCSAFWTTSTSTNGSKEVKNILSDTDYGISCQGKDGRLFDATTTVKVKNSPQVEKPNIPNITYSTSTVSGVCKADTIKVSWTPVINATKYVLERKIDGEDFKTVQNSNKNLFEDKDVVLNKTYYYRVKAFVGASRSVFSDVGSLTIPTDACFTDIHTDCLVSQDHGYKYVLVNKNTVFEVNIPQVYSLSDIKKTEWEGDSIKKIETPSTNILNNIYTTIGIKKINATTTLINDTGAFRFTCSTSTNIISGSDDFEER